MVTTTLRTDEREENIRGLKEACGARLNVSSVCLPRLDPESVLLSKKTWYSKLGKM